LVIRVNDHCLGFANTRIEFHAPSSRPLLNIRQEALELYSIVCEANQVIGV
jgi:hypothetical protein